MRQWAFFTPTSTIALTIHEVASWGNRLEIVCVMEVDGRRDVKSPLDSCDNSWRCGRLGWRGLRGKRITE